MIRSHQYRSDTDDGSCSYKWYLTPCGRSREDHEQVDYKTRELDARRAQALALRSAIVVYIDLAGAPEMIEHILHGNDDLKKYKPTVTVGSSLYGVRIPMMDREGRLPTDEPTA
jgi:hypothetical protein